VLKSFAGGRFFGGTWGSEGHDRPSVLALHGWARTHADFDGVFSPPPDAVPPGAAPPGAVPSAVGPDLPGFGATPPPSEPHGTGWYAEQLLALFEDGELADRVIVVGHSFGGRVALALQQLVPDRIERLVLTGVPLLDRRGRRARPALTFRLGRGLHRAGLIGEERMEALRMRHGSPDYRAASGVMRGVLVRVLAERYDDELPGITCPVTLVWGADDREVPIEVAERAARLLPHATLDVVGGAGHLTPIDAPEAVLRALLVPGANPTVLPAGGPASSPAEGGRAAGSS
jgi:pimeloyl-ACP methyl ester carboxylesterase